ncbi:PH domain-containing protein [Rhodospirillaceae bacterium KN72]|uniref:PH domain-containing protein n=1 Tax=Pacificispira spongiicola TaxID=2729598 RepID=A0A7Y0HGP7_9PROT|nr:PH domain-containing protein [Pacificispira spongiicola]NMM45172.1 PH domain-containing protein [Pacificispira spongiicola]
MTDVYRYGFAGQRMDLLRGVFGLALTLGPLFAVDAILPWIAVILAVLAAFFAIFLIKIWIRHRTEIRVSQDGIEQRGPFGGKTIAWGDVSGLRVAYFASAKSRDGIVTLTLSGQGRKIVVESSLSEFDRAMERIVRICDRADVEMDATTVHNLAALGLRKGAEPGAGSSGG